MDTSVTASDAVEFSTPGGPRILRPAKVHIRADYTHPQWGWMRSIAHFAYVVEPGGAAGPLVYLAGSVFKAGTFDPIGGAAVEIIEGEGQGKRALTLEANGHYMIEFLRLNVPLTVRVSKVGYTAEVKTQTGFLDRFPHINFNLSPDH